MSEENLSLYAITDTLEALHDTMEGCEDEATRAELQAQMQQYMAAEVMKVDGIAGYLHRCEFEQAFLKAEIERLTERKAKWAAKHERVSKYVASVLESLDPDKRGRRAVASSTATLKLAKNPDKVIVTDEEAVPSEYKTLTIKVPATTWEAFVAEVPSSALSHLVRAIPSVECAVRLPDLRRALKTGDVPGAVMKEGENRLVVE